MKKELETWQFAAEKLKLDETVMFLVVVESSGSSPGRRGFKMAVTKDDLAGSIGGGVMEVSLVEEAREILATVAVSAGVPNAFIKEQIHQKNAQNPSGMICSGKQAVVFFRLGPAHLSVAEKIIYALQENEPKILRITQNEFSLKEQSEGDTQNTSADQSGEGFFYEETLGHKNRLFIIGGGHCALALSELMSKMDFHISLFDDRPNLNTLDKNDFVHEKKVIGSYEAIGDLIPGGENDYVTVMTLGYASDEIVIRKLLDKNFKYFGVLGSKAKMKILLRDLEKEGVPGEKLSAIRTPIGLPINSQTPEEIAVSIAAEIVAVKNSAK